MKKLLIILFLAALFTSCTKKDVDYERPDEKLNALRTEYSNLLTSSPNGWIGYLFPKGGGGYTFKFKFDDKNRVNSYATIEEETAANAFESSYRIKADQVLSLFFDTYSYLHLLSDPDPDVMGGSVGAGLISDFEFAILEAGQDTIKLLGNHNQSELLLIRAKADQGDDYIKKAYDYIQEIDLLNQFQYYHNVLSINNKEYQIAINTVNSVVSFFYEENGVFKRHISPYAVVDGGIVLKTALDDGGTHVQSLTNFDIDASLGTVNLKVNSMLDGTIANSATPFIVDKDAPRRMYVENYDYLSPTGFTYGGVRDYLNFATFPNFVGVLFSPRFYTNPADLFAILFNGGSSFVGPAVVSNYDTNGEFGFGEIFGLQGTNPGGTNLTKANDFRTLIMNGGRYYIYQVGENAYDMVSINDSKRWIRFY